MKNASITPQGSPRLSANRWSCTFPPQKHSHRFIFLGSAFIAVSFFSHNAYALSGKPCVYPWSCEPEIAQQASSPGSPQASEDPKAKPPEATAEAKATAENLFTKEQDRLSGNIGEQRKYVTNLRQTNQAWNIAFVAIGVSATLLATALGAVGSASEKAKARTTITIAVIGAVAAATQTIASKIPVAKRAGEYAKVQASLVSLEYRVKAAKTPDDLKAVQTELEKQITKMGEAEAAE
jgi:hypothetical protein